METNRSDSRPDFEIEITSDPDSDLDALLAPLSLLGLGSDPVTVAVPVHTVPIETEPTAPQPLRASSAPQMPSNWVLTSATDSLHPVYLRGLTDAEQPLPSRRSLREASGSPHGRRAASRPRRHRMLWAGTGVGLAASVLIVGALASAGAPSEPAPEVVTAKEAVPFVDDALSRDQPPLLAGPTPLLLDEVDTDTGAEAQPDAQAQPRSPSAPTAPPAAVTQPTPSPSPSPSPSPEPSPTPEPTPEPTTEPTEPPADPAP